MAHAIWTGSVGFGLVNIPVNLYSGEARENALSFMMLDKRDMSPIGYKKINKKTGAEVFKQDIVKGFEFREGEYVTVTDADFKRAAPEKTQRVDIQAFVHGEEIDPAFFSQPYYLEPAARADKVYSLLREAMKRAGKIGIATVVIRAKQYLAAVVPRGEALELVLLRYPDELRDPRELHIPKKLKLSEAELKMAERLIDDLAAPWEPSRYRDEYKDQLLDFIKKKAEKGEIAEVELPEKPKKAEPPADIMALLKASVEGVGKGRAPVPAGRRHGRGLGGGRHVLH